MRGRYGTLPSKRRFRSEVLCVGVVLVVTVVAAAAANNFLVVDAVEQQHQYEETAPTMRQRQLGLRHDRRGYFRGKTTTTSETTTTQVTAIEEEDEEDRLVPQPRIIGGTRVSDSDRLGRYSYFALMNGEALCGAVLIGAKWIVTAAHCAYADDDFELGTMSRPSGSMDFLSSLFGGGGSSVGGRTYDYLNGRMHPDYSDSEVEHDIAIFQLQTAVPRSVAVPIQISAQPVTAATTAVTVLGFGDTNPTEAVTTTSESLREVQLQYIAQDVCDAQFGSNWMTGSYIGDGMMCAYTRGKDSCGGTCRTSVRSVFCCSVVRYRQFDR